MDVATEVFHLRMMPWEFRKRVELHDWINLKTDIAEGVYRQSDGRMLVRVYQMDCDCVESVSYSTIDNSWQALAKHQSKMDRYAEGPCSMRPVTSRGEEWTRDRILEAYEDGHPWSV